MRTLTDTRVSIKFRRAVFLTINLTSRTWGHHLKLAVGKFKTNLRKYSQRVIDVWNRLSVEIMSQSTMDLYSDRKVKNKNKIKREADSMDCLAFLC